nr:YbbR-like domain-containing protein [Cellulophaga sp. 20_2_10]
MRLNVFRKKIQVDLSQLENKKEKYFLRQSVFRRQIEGQLPNSLSLTEVGVLDTLFLDLYKLHTKKVPVVANSKVELKQNYVIEGGLKITPDTIRISGPRAEIDSITKIAAEAYDFENIAANFKAEVALQLPQELSNTKFSANTVVLSGEVYRFSEKILTVSVDVVHLPDGVEIRTFPNKIAILCKAKVDVLREIKSSDFSVVADFNEYVDQNSPILKLKLAKKPAGVYSVKLKEDTVEFILNRQ